MVKCYIMNSISMVFLAFIGLSAATSFINPYPRYKHYKDGGDPGDALFLTPYIERGDIEIGQKLSKVDHPQMNFAPSYSGYITVDKAYNSNLFFWYFPSKLMPETAPVVLWLQGGPGASSLFGLFTENGPFVIESNETLGERTYSWHINHHLIYIDNPAGTGFSFTDDDRGYATNEKDVGNNLYEAMRQFFQLFPQLQSHDFFITGESYGGKYVPALGHAILHRSGDDSPAINLKGLAIGNGLSDPIHQMNYGDYLYQLGLIDLNGLAQFRTVEWQGINCIKRRDFLCAFHAFDRLINMDESTDGSIFRNLTGFDSYFNYINPNASAIQDQQMGDFLQASSTRNAIHVGNRTFHGLDGDENKVEQHLLADIMDSVSLWVAELLSHYNVMIYNGQLDVIVAYPLTERYLQKLKFSGSEGYAKAARHIWYVDGEVAGYEKHCGNLTEVLVRNAGHMAPADQPKWVLDMLLRLTTGKGFH